MQNGGCGISVDEISYRTGLPESKAKKCLKALQQEGFLEKASTGSSFALTPLGLSLASSSGNKGYKRKACDKAFKEFLDRCNTINADPRMPLFIRKVILFGSYHHSPEKEILGDVDICYDFSRRYGNPDDYPHSSEGFTRSIDIWSALRQERIEASGRRLDFMTKLGWDQIELRNILKNRSPILSLSTWDLHEEWLEGRPHQIIEVDAPALLPLEELDALEVIGRKY
jgi:hypothetical protein